MIREALSQHIEDLVEQGLPVPEPAMSIADAAASLAEPEPPELKALFAEIGEPPPTLSFRVEMVEVDVAAPTSVG